jgi:ribosomal protein S27E
MEALSHQRCFNHPPREAVARCPECGRFFCRECITEHEDRVLCAQCLRKRLEPAGGRGRGYGALARMAQLTLGLWLAWLFFHYLGQILLALPSDFHEGVIWSKDWWNL